MAIIDIPLAYRLSYISSLGLGEIIGFSCGYFGRDVARRKKSGDWGAEEFTRW